MDDWSELSEYKKHEKVRGEITAARTMTDI